MSTPEGVGQKVICNLCEEEIEVGEEIVGYVIGILDETYHFSSNPIPGIDLHRRCAEAGPLLGEQIPTR